MQPVTKMRQQYVVLLKGVELPNGLEVLFKLFVVEELRDTVLYRLDEFSEATEVLIEQLLSQLCFTRVFENFWLPPENIIDKKRVLVQGMFAHIARKYDSIITHDLNKSCYEHLYVAAVEGLRRTPSRLLDFGCGTGLITQATFAYQVPFIRGFDFCPNMAKIARDKGLCIIDKPFEKIAADGVFDSILASYVFHYGLTLDEWSSLLTCLADGGGLFGNFHKGIGFRKAIKDIESLGEKYIYEVSDSNFGPVVAVYASS
jgi:hypothetical protein